MQIIMSAEKEEVSSYMPAPQNDEVQEEEGPHREIKGDLQSRSVTPQDTGSTGKATEHPTPNSEAENLKHSNTTQKRHETEYPMIGTDSTSDEEDDILTHLAQGPSSLDGRSDHSIDSIGGGGSSTHSKGSGQLNGKPKTNGPNGRLIASGRRRSTVSVVGRGADRLSWKSDPKRSFCDWRLEVHHRLDDHPATPPPQALMEESSNDTGEGIKQSNEASSAEPKPKKKVDNYNLHRNMVGFGPRKSNLLTRHFLRQMEEQNFTPGSNNTKITVQSYQAPAVPMVLNFLYYIKEAKQTLSAEKACSVYKIAQALEIPPLLDAMEEFYRKTLSLKNMTEFLSAATKAEADRLLVASQAKIGGLIYEKPELAGLVLPPLMAGILKFNRGQIRILQEKNPTKYPDSMKFQQSRVWSKATYVCVHHKETAMTKELFDDMTSEECLPAIDVSVAFKFLILDKKFDSFNTEYKNLQKRCVDSIMGDWQGFQAGFASQEQLSQELQNLPSHVLADILMKSMTKR